MSYSFGSRGGLLELVIDRPETEVDIRPETGAGPSRFTYMALENDGFTYTLTSCREIAVSAGPDDKIDVTFYSLLTVDDPDGSEIVRRPCLADLTYTDLPSLDAS